MPSKKAMDMETTSGEPDIKKQCGIANFSNLLLLVAAIFGSTLAVGADGVHRASSVGSPSFVQIGEVILTHSDIDAYIMDRIREEHRSAFLRDPGRIADLVQQQALTFQLAHQAVENGLDKDPEVIALLDLSAKNELSKLEVRRFLKENMLDSYRNQAQELALTSPDLIDPGVSTLTFEQLLVTGQDDESRLDTAVRMADLYERYREGELDFDALIKHSDDPALDDNSGRYADIDPGRLDENVAAQLAELEPGEISEPFESRYGWHMVRLVSRDYREMSEEERLERFEEIARSRHENSLRQTYLNSLLNQPFEIAPNAVRDLMARHGVELDREQENEITDQLAPEAAEDS